MNRPFRFIAPAPRLTGDPDRWRAEVRRIEDLGFSTVSVGGHLSRGWVLEPVTAMTVAAESTTSLRVLSLVLANDYRHPVLLHKALATLDVFSGGRVEVGIGAGWMASDYGAAGISMAPPGRRIERLEEALTVLTGLLAPGTFSFTGEHYRVEALDGLPDPVQRPRPPCWSEVEDDARGRCLLASSQSASQGHGVEDGARSPTHCPSIGCHKRRSRTR